MATLTALVKQNSSVFSESVVNPVGRVSASIEIEPVSSSIHDATLVGHGFDLWVRCHLVARKKMRRFDPRQVHGFIPGDDESEQAVHFIHCCWHGLSDDDQLCQACIVMASNEIMFRSGMIVETSYDNSQAITDLKNLTQNVRLLWLIRKKAFIANPVLNFMPSPMCGIKADADLIADRTLIEIKTARRRNKQMEAWRQLAGYIVLNDMRDKYYSIEQACLWYPRFNAHWSFPVDRLFSEGGRDRLRQFFERHIDP